MLLHSAPWCSSLAWGSSGGARWDVGVGVPAGGWDTGKQGPPPWGEDPLILNCWSLWLGLAITRWQVNIHFCVKDVSLVWGRLFLLNYVSQSVTDEEWTITDQKVEPTAKQLWIPRQRNSVSADARMTAVKSYWTCIPCMAITITVVTALRLDKGLTLSSRMPMPAWEIGKE